MELFYVHDPMCSWCWAYRPTLERLRRQLPEAIQWRNLLGGLAPDSSDPMPESTRDMIIGHWREIQRQLGTEFNFDFWTICKPRRSTYIACRAVLAAARQGQEEAMIFSIQKAYYLRAMNPSDEEVLVTLAQELGMDSRQFARALNSRETQTELRAQVGLAREWPVSGFPSLILKIPQGVQALPLDYRDAEVTLDRLKTRLA